MDIAALAIEAEEATRVEKWLKIGRGLNIGRAKYKSDKEFGQWVKTRAVFKAVPHKEVRYAAQWLATNWFLLGDGLPVDRELTHPQNIRKWFNEQQLAATPDPIDHLPPTSASLTEASRRAENIAKVFPKARRILARVADASTSCTPPSADSALSPPSACPRFA